MFDASSKTNIDCFLEIIKCKSSVIKKLENLRIVNEKKDDSIQQIPFFVSIKTNLSSKILTNDRITIKDIVLVTRWIMEENNSHMANPCFAIFVHGKNVPWIFSSLSEQKVNNWIIQLNLCCSKMACDSGVVSHDKASTCVNTYGFAYYYYFKIHTQPFFNQIGI